MCSHVYLRSQAATCSFGGRQDGLSFLPLRRKCFIWLNAVNEVVALE